MYKIGMTSTGGQVISLQLDSGATKYFLPDPANTDYQAYLKWLEAGNTPEPADNPTPEE